MTAPLTLFSNAMSRGRIARWMLEEVGQAYDVVYIDFGEQMKSAEYLAINPMGKVPALKHGDTIVTEYAAICAYLADAFPEAGLVPANRGPYYRWLFFGAGPLEAAIINASLGFSVPEGKRGQVGFGSIKTTLDALEFALTENPYLAGDSFSAADVATGSQIGYGLRFGTIESRGVFEAYWNRIATRPAHKRAEALDNAAMQERKG